MIGHLANAMRLQALRSSAARTSSRIGLVQSYDPSNYAVTVELQPEGELTGWLSYAAVWVGNGWGLYAPPTPGQRVSVELIDGDLDSGFAEASFFDNDNRPLEVQSGEFWLVHKSGAFFKLLNTGAVTFSDTKGATLTMDGSGNINSAANQWGHTGNIAVTGNVQATGTVTGTTDVVGGGKSLKSHVHSGVQAGGSDTGPPA